MELKELINKVVEARERMQGATLLRKESYERWAEENDHLFGLEKITKETCQEAETKLREMAIETYLKTLDKAVALGVSIRVMTKLDYDAKEAMEWAVKHELALKLDISKFEKIAKTENLTFVTITEEPTATIATELSRVTG